MLLPILPYIKSKLAAVTKNVENEVIVAVVYFEECWPGVPSILSPKIFGF